MVLGLFSAVSGIRAAQAGLYVTGHNMSNTQTLGYSRQRTVQNDVFYRNVGNSATGALQVGLGTDVASLQQIRNIFLDIRYREETTKVGFYSIKASTGAEIESILGELESSFGAGSIIQDMREAINELSMYQSGLETRGIFVSSSISFLTKANNVFERLFEYQQNLDKQVRDTVSQINSLVEEINMYNSLIYAGEVSGDNANDYRDSRNVALDKLSQLIKIETFESKNGIDIIAEGNQLLVGNVINKIGFKYASSGYPFVEPVFTAVEHILPFDAPQSSYREIFSLTGVYNADDENGLLKGLLVNRGSKPANYVDLPQPPDPTNYAGGINNPQYKIDKKAYDREIFNSTQAFIPKVQREFDILINSIVTMINDSVSPYTDNGSGVLIKDTNAPFGLDGSQYTEVFVRKYMDRFTGNNYNPEDPNNPSSLYTIGNIQINPLLLDASGYNLLAFSKVKGDNEDPSLLLEMLDKWNSNFISINGAEPRSVDDVYSDFIARVGTETESAMNNTRTYTISATQADSNRMQISGVSLDEEMANMLKYQHAYNAASRLVTVIDSMLEKIINL